MRLVAVLFIGLLALAEHLRFRRLMTEADRTDREIRRLQKTTGGGGF